MPASTNLLIVGAGPFGLAVARQAAASGLEYVMAGTPMGFWTAHMPAGMCLRSAADWHLDPCEVLTIERFRAARGVTRAEAAPLSIERYLEYARWYREQAGLVSDPTHVRRIGPSSAADAGFAVEFADGRRLHAKRVVLALGFQFFAHVPADLAGRLPPGRFAHTRDVVHFERLRRRRVLIVGGRQSAYEWAALIAEGGAASVDVVHRHDAPQFAESDWSWVAPMVARFEDEPGWYRRLAAGERDAIARRLWAEGRLKLEPWLAERCRAGRIRVRARAEIAAAAVIADGSLQVSLTTGDVIAADDIILATGYKPDGRRVPLLCDLLPRIAIHNGCPVLDDSFQTSIPGLFATSMLAVEDFGPFFAFTGAVRTSARLIGRALQTGPPTSSRWISA